MNDITIFRNRTYPFTYNHTDTAGAAVSLTGATVYFTVKSVWWDSSAADTTALIQKTITSHTDPDAGVTEWTINDSDTDIAPGRYYYDVVVEFDGKSQPPSLYGKFTVTGTPTNRNVGNE